MHSGETERGCRHRQTNRQTGQQKGKWEDRQANTDKQAAYFVLSECLVMNGAAVNVWLW